MLRQAVLLCLFLAGMTKAQGEFQKALGQLSGTLSESRVFSANTTLTDFQQDAAFRDFINENGQLNVTQEGFYFIYAQAFFEHYPDGPLAHNRVALTVNGNPFGTMQPGRGNQADYGNAYTGGVTKLNVGDLVGLMTVEDSRLWVSYAHTFFGAYRVSQK